MLDSVAQLSARRTAAKRFVSLGDLVDRGPDSIGSRSGGTRSLKQ